MFEIEDLAEIARSRQFLDDCKFVLRTLAINRLGEGELFQSEVRERLRYFVECVLCSAPDWVDGSGLELCRVSGEIAEALAINSGSVESQEKMRFRSALLFELAELPAISTVVLRGDDFAPLLRDLFARHGMFGALSRDRVEQMLVPENGTRSLVELGLSSDVLTVGQYLQGGWYVCLDPRCGTIREDRQ